MYKALLSFTTIKSYHDVQKGEILASDFDTPEEIQKYLDIGYIEEFNGSIGITQNGTYDVTDYEQAVVNVGGGGSDLDWTALGYEERPEVIDDGYNYALQIKNNWVPASNLSNKFKNDYKLIIMPLVDTSIASITTSMFAYCYGLKEIPLLDISKSQATSSMFSYCYSLTTIPVLNLSSVSGANNIKNMFYYCPSLTDESLDNVLKSCISATSVTSGKTLSNLGFNSSDYPVSRIQALPSYQDFIDAGWTIGY